MATTSEQETEQVARLSQLDREIAAKIQERVVIANTIMKFQAARWHIAIEQAKKTHTKPVIN